jgi:hypothetical protein
MILGTGTGRLVILCPKFMSLPGRFVADTEEVSGYRDPLGLSELCLVPVSNMKPYLLY